MTKFTDLKLDPKVLSAVADAGYETPTPIQAGAIPAALEGRDVLGIAQTGTGKTAAFVLPMISLLGRGRAKARMPRSLVLCPTRELAAQVAENFDTYAKNHRLTKALLIGGVSFKDQDVAIDRGVDVLIATPGRLLDHRERGKLILNDVKVMVIDEADRMLDMGFIPDIERIFEMTPPRKQTLFFSATMAPEIERITKTFLKDPFRVEVARQATTAETIEQGVVMFRASRKDRQPSEKRELLRKLIEAEGEACTNAMIFCNRKSEVDILAKSLQKHGYDAAPIHGDLDQSQRTRTLEGFRDKSLRFLVCSDVAARGLDIPSVSHVFNFDVPSHPEDYVHRIGRTGRAGRSGKAIMICTPGDEKYLDQVERLLGKTIPRLESPMGGSAEAPAEDAPAPERSSSSSRSRSRSSRSRSSSRRSDGDKAKPQDTAAAPVAEQSPEPAETEAPQAPEKQAAEKPAGEKKEQSGRGRQDSRRENKKGDAVVGMGDHLPSFIALSFDQRRPG
ncbi:DEAD/DEAH box helicase [Frigidibacter sp. ROC022]|uniref:DEAD/DEAH box helicase n=1 Tax=Frigidibacter sp. ROC022 TaxID=2971796 RepID=UPI00215A0E8F|nr:DEAD/DEAH box helicase [Frigidibacter sp. ROC022]MCR8723295.1 DEAD/DEAH box helicase [Frigidibacter sp. ROC022]